MSIQDTNDIENRFMYHAPKDEQTKQAHEAIRNSCKTLAHFINGQVPPGRERSLAITSLEEAMFWANAAIARSNNG